MSSVLPAKSTRVGALDSMIMSFQRVYLACRQSSQFAGINQEAQAKRASRQDKITRVARGAFSCLRRLRRLSDCESSAAGPRLFSLVLAPGLVRSIGGSALRTFHLLRRR